MRNHAVYFIVVLSVFCHGCLNRTEVFRSEGKVPGPEYLELRHDGTALVGGQQGFWRIILVPDGPNSFYAVLETGQNEFSTTPLRAELYSCRRIPEKLELKIDQADPDRREGKLQLKPANASSCKVFVWKRWRLANDQIIEFRRMNSFGGEFWMYQEVNWRATREVEFFKGDSSFTIKKIGDRLELAVGIYLQKQ